MRLHELQPGVGSTKDRKRLGRGNASGQGTTAGKGTKGQKARSGGTKAGFRGVSSRNQRMAKRPGFNNKWRVENQAVNLGDLVVFEAGATISPETLAAAGLIRSEHEPVKLLADGDIVHPLTFIGVKTSASARQKIEAAGGSVSNSEQEAGGASSSA